MSKNRGEQILVVDDDQAIRWTLREALQSWGFAAIEAGSVADGLTRYRADLPDAVLLDIDLPDGSGLDVLREIKREHAEAVNCAALPATLIESELFGYEKGALSRLTRWSFLSFGRLSTEVAATKLVPPNFWAFH